jgi:hypothetical protein
MIAVSLAFSTDCVLGTWYRRYDRALYLRKQSSELLSQTIAFASPADWAQSAHRNASRLQRLLGKKTLENAIARGACSVRAPDKLRCLC